MSDKPLKVAIYARVSTTRDQSPEAQVFELKAFCEARGWSVEHELSDHGFSGGTDQRPALKKLMKLAQERKIDAVVILKLDRLFRSIAHLIRTMDLFEQLGVKLIAVRDGVDLTTAQGRMFATILGALAEFEKNLIRERTLIGLDHARRKGKVLGRPRQHDFSLIKHLRSIGKSYREISRSLGCSVSTVCTALKEDKAASGENT